MITRSSDDSSLFSNPLISETTDQNDGECFHESKLFEEDTRFGEIAFFTIEEQILILFPLFSCVFINFSLKLTICLFLQFLAFRIRFKAIYILSGNMDIVLQQEHKPNVYMLVELKASHSLNSIPKEINSNSKHNSRSKILIIKYFHVNFHQFT